MNRHQIAAEKYLSRAFKINLRIKSKAKIIEELHDLATKVTATISDMPKAPSKSTSRMEEVVCRIVDLEAEIRKDMEELVALEHDIVFRIKALGEDNSKCQVVLELRYLSGKDWTDIAEALGYTVDNVYRIHRRALNLIELP